MQEDYECIKSSVVVLILNGMPSCLGTLGISRCSNGWTYSREALTVSPQSRVFSGWCEISTSNVL